MANSSKIWFTKDQRILEHYAEVANKHLKRKGSYLKHSTAVMRSQQEAPGSAVTHKDAFDQSVGMRQDESWLCLANDTPSRTINDSGLKAANKLLFLNVFFSFYQCAFRRPDKTGQDRTGGFLSSLSAQGGRTGNVLSIFFSLVLPVLSGTVKIVITQECIFK